MLYDNEKQLLNFIRYSPVVFITFIAILLNILIYVENSVNFQKEIKKEKENFIQTQKVIVQKEVEKAYNMILFERADIEENLKKDIKDRVYGAYTIIESIYNNYKHLGDKKVLELIKNALRDIRFNEGRGYFFIDDINGVKQLQPINPEFEGKSFLEFKDAKGYQFVKTISQTIKDKTERFDEYYWTKPQIKDKAFKKISFYKTFAPLNFAIGAGEYLDEFTKKVQIHLLNNRINKIRFGENGYVFIVNYDGKFLTHIQNKLKDKTYLDLTDINGVFLIKKIINIAKEGDGFLTYTDVEMPQTGKVEKKTTYVKGLSDWNWAIGAGFYEKELSPRIAQKELELKEVNQDSFNKILLGSLLTSICFIILSVYISKILQGYFIRYNKRIAKEVDENRRKDNVLYQQSKMAAMGEMIANIAHQWRQPLSVITSLSTSMQLQKELDISDKKSEIQGLENITKNAEYLSHTIDDFRDFFKSHKEKTNIDVKSIIDKTLTLLNSKLIDKDINIIQNIENVQLNVIENELIQLLINLINNAEDALVDIEGKKIVFVSTSIKKDKFIIKIKDNAGGVPTNILPRIFEPYFTTKHKKQGTGIGLYMVKEIISRHMGGSIDVKNTSYSYENKEYKGAEFTITFLSSSFTKLEN